MLIRIIIDAKILKKELKCMMTRIYYTHSLNAKLRFFY